ncbi:S9 family peptidase [Nonomuraea longicatena]
MSFPEQFERTRRFTVGLPTAVTRDFYLRDGSLWSGEREVARDVGSYTLDGGVAAFARDGRVWTVTAGGEPRRLPTEEPAERPYPDPTGRRVAYVCDGALRVTGDDGDRPVAAPDGPEVTFGLAEYVAVESLERDRGFWWSPDGERLLVARVDTAKVGRRHLADLSDPSRPGTAVPYPAAGTANADVSLWITDLDGARTPVDTRGMEYVTAAGWDATGPYAAVMPRDQRLLQVLAIDPDTGASRVLSEQRDPAWVTLVPGLPARTAAGVLVTAEDHDDTRRLVYGGAPVTPPGLQLEEVLSVDGESVVFSATAEPTEQHRWIYDPAAGLRPYESPWRAPSRVERPVLELRRELLRLGPRELRAALYLPSGHDGGPLPVLLEPYGGLGLRKVLVRPNWWDYVSQWFAEQGFAVLAIDGRGTPGRGPAWERAVHHDIAGPVLDDQVEGLMAAAALRPELDLSRVAIRGWSFGGFLATLAVLRRPDVFHVGVAGAGVTDQRMYHTFWRERDLGHPDEHPDAYERCSTLLEAGSLRRPLLLVHGLLDDNVHPANTLRLSSALTAAGRPHEVLLLPGAGHRVDSARLLRHQLDFIRRNLSDQRP